MPLHGKGEGRGDYTFFIPKDEIHRTYFLLEKISRRRTTLNPSKRHKLQRIDFLISRHIGPPLVGVRDPRLSPTERARNKIKRKGGERGRRGLIDLFSILYFLAFFLLDWFKSFVLCFLGVPKENYIIFKHKHSPNHKFLI
jgi:hypothetical protein